MRIFKSEPQQIHQSINLRIERNVVDLTKTTLLKNKQGDHLRKLSLLAQEGQWEHLQTHTAHPDSGFDWWMFPIDRASSGHGDTYKVDLSDVEILKRDPVFMKNYRDGVILVAKSWGWDLELGVDITNSSQKWTNYQVRLGKMLHSLRLFGQEDLYRGMVQFVEEKSLHSTLEPWIQNLVNTNQVSG